ncbi:MAG: glycosyltransferase [Aquificota bacterium]|nr:glycosyltransferase [Aquificota bacterium]
MIGKGFRNIDEIKASADPNTELIFYPSAEEMKNLMLDADIAISAGGQTLYELARVGVPTIAVAVAENQMWNVSEWQEAGFIEAVEAP